MSSTAEADHSHDVLPFDQWPEDDHYGGASLGKVGMWIFLLSDALTFAGFLLAYGILRAGIEPWWCTEAMNAAGSCSVGPLGFEPEMGINFTAGLTFLLICSSVTMVMGYAAVVEGDRKSATRWILLTAFGGMLFLCGQAQEYFGAFAFIFHHEGLIAEGLIWGESARASTFYLITSFHGAHVTTGVIYLLITAWLTSRGKYDGGNYNHIEMCGLFWHFVDLIWIIVFTFIYLIPE